MLRSAITRDHSICPLASRADPSHDITSPKEGWVVSRIMADMKSDDGMTINCMMLPKVNDLNTAMRRELQAQITHATLVPGPRRALDRV